MPTTVSTTPLTTSEVQLLNDGRAHLRCAALTGEISRLQSRLAALQADKVAADATLQQTYTTMLASKNPAVTVPQGATIVRQTINGQDSLLVQTP